MRKMWTKWGLNPRPHATELLPELAKQARYHCAIRPFHDTLAAKDTYVPSKRNMGAISRTCANNSHLDPN